MKKVGLIGLVIAALLVITASASAATISIVPDRDEVAPGDQFTVDIYVNDTTARAVFVNFAYDTSLVEYISGATEGVFTFTDSLVPGDGYVKYLGLSTTDVDISGKPKVASVTFEVRQDAPDGSLIDFNVIDATVDANTADTEVGSLNVVTEGQPPQPPQSLQPQTPTPNAGPITVGALAIDRLNFQMTK